jgi:hypothetical protein
MQPAALRFAPENGLGLAQKWKTTPVTPWKSFWCSLKKVLYT